MNNNHAHYSSFGKLVGGGKQENVHSEGRNMWVLRDIGNLVAVPAVKGKPQNQITCPATRSFDAQLLANAQAAAEKHNCKKAPAENVNGLVGKDGSAKANGLSKKEQVVIKPENDAVIVIGPDEEGSHKSGTKVREASSKKPSKTLTAILTARSKMENMTFFYAELGLMNYSTILQYSPSKLSASAVYAARCTLNRSPLWTETLKHYTGYSEDQLMYANYILALILLVRFHSGAAGNKLKAVS